MAERYCEPEACDCCQYTGNGDMFCDKYMTFVMEDWGPTEAYMMCQGGDHDARI